MHAHVLQVGPASAVGQLVIRADAIRVEAFELVEAGAAVLVLPARVLLHATRVGSACCVVCELDGTLHEVVERLRDGRGVRRAHSGCSTAPPGAAFRVGTDNVAAGLCFVIEI